MIEAVTVQPTGSKREAPTGGGRAQGPLRLALNGPAGLFRGDEPVRVRRKGLALLYYLALEESARREFLADLLWGHSLASNNLRVELHRLREALAKAGCQVFESGEDPLILPSCIEVSSAPARGELMEGLEDVSPEYQAWLESKRASLGQRKSDLLRHDLADGLLRKLRSGPRPYLIITKGQPTCGYDDLPRQLAQRLGIANAEAREFIDRYFERFPGVRRYLDEQIERARAQGYVETLTGRRRYIPEIASKNFNIRSFGERAATNAPIQGTAADLIKRAMIDIHRDLERGRARGRMLLQVHDELLFEVPRGEERATLALIRERMEGAAELRVPLRVETGTGENWLACK